MSRIYDVYGLGGATLDGEARRLAVTLDVDWQRHDSDYRGVYDRASAARFGGGDFVLQANRLPDDELQLPDHPEYELLLFVNRCPGADKVRARMASVPPWEFVRREVLD
jgi:hypothetical protein